MSASFSSAYLWKPYTVFEFLKLLPVLLMNKQISVYLKSGTLTDWLKPRGVFLKRGFQIQPFIQSLWPN